MKELYWRQKRISTSLTVMEEVGVTVSSYLWNENRPLVIVFQEKKKKQKKTSVLNISQLNSAATQTSTSALGIFPFPYKAGSQEKLCLFSSSLSYFQTIPDLIGEIILE